MSGLISVRDVNQDPAAANPNRPVAGDDRGLLLVNEWAPGDLYRLFVPNQAAGANKVHLDLFNGSTDKAVELLSCFPVVSGAVAVVGALAVDLFLTRTTAVGTTGTAAVAESTALTVTPAICKLDANMAALPATITARSAPGGGATAGAVLAQASVFTEETGAGTYLSGLIDMARRVGNSPPITLRPNSGIRVVQGAVASVGNIGFELTFGVRANAAY